MVRVMWNSPKDLRSETQALRARLGQIEREVGELEEKLTKARDQRDRLLTALEALVPAVPHEEATRDLTVEHTGKYRALWQWLTKNQSNRVKLSFAEIEKILGFPLPPSSRRHLPHWYGYGGSAVARAIHDAGFTSSRVNLKTETVEFVRRQPA